MNIGGVSLLLNGRPSSMTYEQLITLLKGMPASRVEKAEVMYSAPPQYHVRGAAINLVLKGYKPGEGGLQGEVNGEYKQQKEAGGNGGVTLAYTSPKIDLDFMYNLQSNYTRGNIDFIARHTVKEQVYDVNQVTDNEGRSLTHTLRAGGTYKFDKDNSLNLSYTTQFSPDKTGDSHSNGNISESFNHSQAHHQMHNAALYYTSGFGFQAGADYTYFTSTDTQNFFDRSPEEVETRFISCSDQHIDRWKIYADQHHTLPQNWTLNYGTSFTYVNNRNTQNYDLPEMQDNNLHSRIREYTYNVYAGFDKPFNSQWTLSASTTLEYYQMQDYRKWAVYPTRLLDTERGHQLPERLQRKSGQSVPSSLHRLQRRPDLHSEKQIHFSGKLQLYTRLLHADRLPGFRPSESHLQLAELGLRSGPFFHRHSPFQGRKLVEQPSHPAGYLETRQSQCILRCTFQSEAMGRRRPLDTYLPAMPPAQPENGGYRFRTNKIHTRQLRHSASGLRGCSPSLYLCQRQSHASTERT